MKNIILLCFLLLSRFLVQAQHPVSEVGVELLDLFPKPTASESAEQAKLRMRTLDIRESEIVLDLNTGISQLDTIIERGKYKLLIKHDTDIVQFGIWKNDRPIKRIEKKDNKTYALFRGIRSRINSRYYASASIQPTSYRYRWQVRYIRGGYVSAQGVPILPSL